MRGWALGAAGSREMMRQFTEWYVLGEMVALKRPVGLCEERESTP